MQVKTCNVCGTLINRNAWRIEICFSTISKKAAHKSPGFLRGFAWRSGYRSHSRPSRRSVSSDGVVSDSPPNPDITAQDIARTRSAADSNSSPDTGRPNAAERSRDA